MLSEETIYNNVKNNNDKRLIEKFETLRENGTAKLDMKHNKDWFVNRTEKIIPTNIQWLLSLGSKFALPNTRETFPLFKCITDGEQCIQTIEDKEQQEISRAKFVTLIDDHMRKSKMNARDKLILNTVVQCEKYLEANNDIIILNSDKGNKTVAMTKDDYNTKMMDIIKDMCTYRRLKKDPTLSLQNKNNILVEKLYKLNVINLLDKNKLTTRIAIAPRIYGLPKIHKKDMPLRPICSSINSPSYNLSKYIIDILRKLTNDSIYNVRDAREFKNRIDNTRIEDDEILVSFDVVSLFPSIPINLAIKTIDRKWHMLEEHTKIPRELFMDILTFCIKDCRYFKFKDNFYEQNKGMPMGSPISPIIADIVMEELLETTLDQLENKPRLMTKYVDDLFGILKKDQVEITLRTLNAFHRRIQFTLEKEIDNRLPYLDSIIIRRGNMIKLDWYQKPMASGRLINFYSKHPKRIIMNTATNFITRVLDTSNTEFHKNNLSKIKNILLKNDFPYKTINHLIDNVLNKENREKSEPSRKIYQSVEYISGLSERIKHSDIYDKEKYTLAMKTNNTTYKLFNNMKSKLDKLDKSNLVYEIKCNGDETNICQKVYVGTTKTKLRTRLSSHKSDLRTLDKPLNQKTALAAHCAITGHQPDFEKVRILAGENNHTKRYLQEMLHIINTPTEKRINYKTDTDNCAHIYRHTINKYRNNKQKNKIKTVSHRRSKHKQQTTLH
ncbi:uncharacterized protein LOC119614495 [Lucilia sericata]|uniref:uncharacterized protein LOC119614495 n=2 Tax=Lucilia sericata TaxID=13632 RepID=UPI0018A82F5B|nr:uncharacterized protein LOC119614495 [Lucilia sericata]